MPLSTGKSAALPAGDTPDDARGETEMGARDSIDATRSDIPDDARGETETGKKGRHDKKLDFYPDSVTCGTKRHRGAADRSRETVSGPDEIAVIVVRRGGRFPKMLSDERRRHFSQTI
jgi:hypothetical protein